MNKPIITRVLSYDVGLRNLAHCLMCETNHDGKINWEIESWERVDVISYFGHDWKVPDMTLDQSICITIDYLSCKAEEILKDVSINPVHKILIEMQPGMSEKLGAVMSSICAFYRCWFNEKRKIDNSIHMPEFSMYNASQKLVYEACDLPLKYFDVNHQEISEADKMIALKKHGTKSTDSTKQNKAKAIQQTFLLLRACPSLKRWKKIFEQTHADSKVDDLSDALFQAIHKLMSKANNKNKNMSILIKKRSIRKPKKPRVLDICEFELPQNS